MLEQAEICETSQGQVKLYRRRLTQLSSSIGSQPAYVMGSSQRLTERAYYDTWLLKKQQTTVVPGTTPATPIMTSSSKAKDFLPGRNTLSTFD